MIKSPQPIRQVQTFQISQLPVCLFAMKKDKKKKKEKKNKSDKSIKKNRRQKEETCSEGT